MTVGARLVSVQVGQPQSLGSSDAASPFDEPWTSSIFKRTVDGPLAVSLLGPEGNGQADLVNHGGPDKAICAYPADHYDYWRDRLDLDLTGFPYGAFGENFTLRDVTETAACIGDTWKIGSLLVQVSQPRQPCWKLARKWRIKTFADDVIKSGRTGWYFRVLEPATVDVGDSCTLVERPNPEWTIARANTAMHRRPFERALRAELATVPLLSAAWQRTLTRTSSE